MTITSRPRGDLLAAIAQYETRSLSIELRQRAQQWLVQAKAEADYDHFQRARFNFEESLEKWDGNDEAREGLRDAKLSCAKLALEDQNFDLGLDVLEETDGDAEAELRKQLATGKQTRDRRKKLVAGLAIGLAGSILAGILINGYMINENFKSVKARDEAVDELEDTEVKLAALDVEKQKIASEKEDLKNSIEPMRLEKKEMQATIEAFDDKLVAQTDEFNERTAKQTAQYRAQEKQLKLEQARKQQELQSELATLGEQKETLVDEKLNLVEEKQKLEGQVVDLNESSKLLRYKGSLTQISTDLQAGDYRDARKGLAQYQNQQDWEVGRLNLLAHREIKSLYPSEPITSISATADGKQVAIVFPAHIEIRSVDQLDQPGIQIDVPNVAAVAISPDGNQLFAGKPSDSQDSAGKIEVFDLTQQTRPKLIRTLAAQSVSIYMIEVNETGNAMLSVGKTSALRQSSGQSLEEPMMVWIDGQKENVKLVLPNGSKPKFDSASFSKRRTTYPAY